MQIVPFQPQYAAAFSALNRDWIERLFHIEPADLKVLDHPQQAIIAPGGQILFAMDRGEVVGTAALLPTAPGEFELAKMAVGPSHQGRGVGERLGRAAIAWALERRPSRLFLVTNSSLAGAIRLYERLGFVHRPMPPHSEYARADVYMEYPVHPACGCGAVGPP
jgi:GNAT superfamily N-acetyltransferase